MLVNGIPTDIGTFDLYTLMEQIRKEVLPQSTLPSHGNAGPLRYTSVLGMRISMGVDFSRHEDCLSDIWLSCQ